MIIVISAQNSALDSMVDHRFGRSPWLIRMDTDNHQWEGFHNPGVEQSGGAGIAAAQFAIDQNANVVLSGDFGPHAAGAFRAANIEMRIFTKDITTVQQAIDGLESGILPIFQ